MTGARSLVAALLVVLAVPSGLAAADTESEWSIVPSSNAVAEHHNFVNAVDCVAPTDCWAVGRYWAEGVGYDALVLRGDGSSWSLASSPVVASSQTALNDVACIGSSHCWAVGFYFDELYRPLILRWDGEAWSVGPAPDAVEGGQLYGVSCTSPDECWAVGSAANELGRSGLLILRWDGVAWSPVPAPSTLPSRGGILVSVDCPSASDCWAVGNATTATAGQPLAMRWDGDEWSLGSADTAGTGTQNVLSEVSCLSPSECWAVGYQNVGSTNQTMIQRWDGARWTIVPSPNAQPLQANTLFSVSCVSSRDCWAVGYHKPGNPLQTLILRWDGGAWRLVPSANSSPGQTNTLRSVSCAGSVCAALGNYYNAQSISRTLALRHTGSDPSLRGQQPPMKIGDVAGDANGLGDAGIEQDTTPASVDPLDILEVATRTRYETIEVGDDGIEYEPTHLEIVTTTTGAPDVPAGMPNVVFRLETLAGTCRLGLESVLVRESPTAPVTTVARWHELGAGCPNAGSFPALRELSDAEVTIDPASSTVTLAVPFSSLTEAETSAIGVGATLVASRGETRGPTLHAGQGNETVVDRSELVDASPRGDPFVVGSDVPPDVPCTSGCPG